MKRAALGIALAWVAVSGCTDDATTADLRGEQPIDPADVYVHLPPPTPELRGVPADQLILGEWDWGAPCRVSVREEISGDRDRVVRMYSVEVAADPDTDGYLMAFGDVTLDDRLLDEDAAAEAVFGYLAVLADMRLASDGRFVEFLDLERALAEVADRAGHSSPDRQAAILARHPVVEATILDRTIMGWYGYWLDHRRLPVNPATVEAERTRDGSAGSFRATTEAFASPVHSDGPSGPIGRARPMAHLRRTGDRRGVRSCRRERGRRSGQPPAGPRRHVHR